MVGKLYRQRSLKTRVTLFALAILLACIWSLAYYASRILRTEMQELLGAQQFSTASFVASDINDKVEDSFKLLASVAQSAAPLMEQGTPALQKLLDERPVTKGKFNGGILIHRADGTAIAEYPAGGGRVGVNYMDIDTVAAAIVEGRPSVGKPVLGKQIKGPVVGMAAPIRDRQGRVLGAIAGVINLGAPNFLDKIAASGYGREGSFLLVDRQHRIIITASDKSLVMEQLPAPGINPAIDNFLAGREGSAILVNPRGTEVLAASKGIPVAGWNLVVDLPTSEAFAPIRDVQFRVVVAALLLTLLAGLLIRQMLRRELAPMFAAAATLAAGAREGAPLQPLPPGRDDELGALIGGVNTLILAVAQREAALFESRERFDLAVGGSSDAIWDWNLETGAGYVSDRWWALLGYGTGTNELSGKGWLDMIHPDDAARVRGALREHWKNATPYAVEARFRGQDGNHRWFLIRGQSIRNKEGRATRMAGSATDITERKLTEMQLQTQYRTLAAIIENFPGAISLFDAEFRLAACNEQFKRLLDLPDSLFTADRMRFEDFIRFNATRGEYGPGDPDEQVAAIVAEARKGIPHRFERTRPNGVTLEIRGTPLPDGGLVTLYIDVSERRAAEAQLRKLSLAVEQAAETILITNTDAVIEYANKAFIDATGYAREEVIGRNPRFLQSGRTPRETYATMWATLVRGDFWSGEFVNRRKDGSEFIEDVTITPLRQPDGQVTHYVAVKTDVTEKRRLARELDAHRNHLETLVAQRTAELVAAREQAEAANQAKSAFLANMSHEIRTPMNGIIGMAHLLRRGGVTPQQADRLDKIDSSAEHLLRILNNILDISKIEAGKLQLEEAPLLVEGILARVRAMLAEAATAKGIALRTEIDSLPAGLIGDRTRLQQALLNFAGNAIKFTEQGSVTLRVRKEMESDDLVRLRFEIEDTGIGIAAAALPRLFGAFEQADNSTTRRYGGTGLGLAITRRLVELMGGETGVESAPGVGSTFWFTVGLKKGAVAPEAAESLADAGETIRRDHAGARILVADDEPLNREIARFQLEEIGLGVDEAEDGEEAVSMAARTTYAAILMDMQMPKLSGLDATRRIRALPGRRQVPIIAMTANAFDEDRRRCVEAGMDDFLGKPLDHEAFIAVLLRWLAADRDRTSAT